MAKQAARTVTAHADAGFWAMARNSQMFAQVKERAAQIKSPLVVVCGIGGSSLGAQSLCALTSGRRVKFIENLDPVTLQTLKSDVENLSDVHWLWISKSGETLETLTILELVSTWYKAANLDIAKNSTVITQAKTSQLYNWAKAKGIVWLEIPANVTGRFSALSPSGLLPAALAGVNLDELRRGADSVQADDEKVAQIVEATLQSWERKEFTTAIWTYSDQLKNFGLWIQQLWAESLGKATTKSGGLAPRASQPVACRGSVDQHSILQQFMEGPKTNWMWFVRVDALEKSGEKIKGKTVGEIFAAQAEGTRRAFGEAGVSTMEWQWPKLDAFTLAQGMLMMEVAVAAIAERMGINAFNQPGVERGKNITKELLQKN